MGKLITLPFAALLRWMYSITGSYGVAIILFSLILKLILLPFQMKSKRSMVRMGRLSGKQAELQKQREQQAEELQAFLEKATAAREELLRETRGELCELSLAIAEKVIHVSLNSSSEVVARMIQVATEKLKRQEWVHIYIAGCDAKGIAQISPSLTASLGALSEHIRIVPMGDDEAGTCIVETPAGIIDASVSTQLSNIKDILKERL